MNKVECKEVLDFLRYNYQNISITNEMVDVWFNELQQYDKEDIMLKLKDMIGWDIFQLKAPSLMAIVKDVPKTQQKLDWNKGVAYCNYCGRAFTVGNGKEKNSMDEIHQHEDRCRSIKYINKKYSIRYKDRELTNEEKRNLYNMSKEEFDGYYDKILKYIYDHTDNEMEKTCIDHIFNPPNAKDTKKIFGVE